MHAEKGSIDRDRVAAQLGRVPRDPWRVAARCVHGYPQTIVSPARLADGTPFPTWSWLTCPWLAREISRLESAGEIPVYAERIASDPSLATALLEAEVGLRQHRAEESGGEDPCAGVGVAGQVDTLATKCLHAHVALALAGVSDPIGNELLARLGSVCGDSRCARIESDSAKRGAGSHE